MGNSSSSSSSSSFSWSNYDTADKCLITSEEFQKVADSKKYYKGEGESKEEFLDPLMLKVVGFTGILKKAGRLSHQIECTKYDKIYAIGDLHSDLPNFISILAKSKIIKFVDESDVEPVKIYGDNNNRSFYNAKWNGGSKVLLVIVGDLVDGKRGDVQVDDKNGNFEILIHLFLHNLRIQANKEDSEVLFTIGNHDYETALSPKNEGEGMYNTYVTNTAKSFFGNVMWNRVFYLSKFYINSPYLFLSLMNGDIEEVRLTHAGMHEQLSIRIGEAFDIVKLNLIQDSIKKKIIATKLEEIYSERNPIFEMFNNIKNKDRNYDTITQGVNGRSGSQMLWTRAAATYESKKCQPLSTLNKSEDQYDPILIVGHCVTWTYQVLVDVILPRNENGDKCVLGDGDYNEDKTHLCIAADCPDIEDKKINTRYSIDVGISSVMRNPGHESKIPEILVLEKGTGKRYYNDIHALADGKDRPFPVSQTGGKKAKNNNVIHLASCCNCANHKKHYRKFCKNKSSSVDFTKLRLVTSMEDLGFSMPRSGSEKPSYKLRKSKRSHKKNGSHKKKKST
jgi:hypothetical protein